MLSALLVLAAVGVSGFYPLHAQQLFSHRPPSRRIFTLPIVPVGVAVRAQDGRDILNAGAVTTFQPSRLTPTLDFQMQVISRGTP
jgi:hypothetical protein